MKSSRSQLTIVVVLVAITVVFAMPGTTLAQGTRIATVDVEKLQEQSVDFQQALDKLDEMRREFDDRRERLERALGEITEDISRAEDAGSTSRAESMRRKLWQKSSEFQDFMEETFGADGIVESQAQELLAPLYDRLAEASQAVAEEYGFDLVLDAAELNPLFVAESLDITELVLRAFEKP